MCCHSCELCCVSSFNTPGSDRASLLQDEEDWEEGDWGAAGGEGDWGEGAWDENGNWVEKPKETKEEAEKRKKAEAAKKREAARKAMAADAAGPSLADVKKGKK